MFRMTLLVHRPDSSSRPRGTPRDPSPTRWSMGSDIEGGPQRPCVWTDKNRSHLCYLLLHEPLECPTEFVSFTESHGRPLFGLSTNLDNGRLTMRLLSGIQQPLTTGTGSWNIPYWDSSPSERRTTTPSPTVTSRHGVHRRTWTRRR